MILVVIFYAILYGLFGLFCIWIHLRRSSRVTVPLHQAEFALNSSLGLGFVALNEEMHHIYFYLESVMPVVFGSDSWQMRLKREILRHHRYLSIFDSSESPKRRVLVLFHALTVQLILIFFVALFYDIEVFCALLPVFVCLIIPLLVSSR